MYRIHCALRIGLLLFVVIPEASANDVEDFRSRTTLLARALQIENLSREKSQWIRVRLSQLATDIKQQHFQADSPTKDQHRGAPIPADATQSIRRQIEVIHQRLHRDLLVGPFQANSFSTSESLQGGPYNCLTATLITLELLRLTGIEAQAVAGHAHVYCRVPAAGWELETTCADFRHAHRPISPAATQAVRTLDDHQLLAKLYYNRAIYRCERQDFAAAIEDLNASLRLDPLDPNAVDNRLAALNNWALQLVDRHQFEQALERIHTALSLDPHSPTLLENETYINRCWVKSLVQQAEFEQALRVLHRGLKRRPDEPLFDRGRLNVYLVWSEYLLNQGDLAGCQRIMREAQVRLQHLPVEQAQQHLASRIQSEQGLEAARGETRVLTRP